MSTQNFLMLFKEQWWCAGILSALSEDKLSQAIKEMSSLAIEILKNTKEEDINPAFVPDPKDRQMIVKIANNLKIETTWNSLSQHFSYQENNRIYSEIGYILFRIRIDNEMIIPSEVRPTYLQQVIFIVWNAVIKKFKGDFIFDDFTPPYAISIATGYEPAQPIIEWDKDMIDKYRTELGQWGEIYSGQFEDYRDELYRGRISFDLSNRKSEIHIINRNSAFFYFNPENYDNFFLKNEENPKSSGYIFNSVIKTIAKIRTIQYIMQIVTYSIDSDTNNLALDIYLTKKTTEIKNDLEKTNRLKNELQRLLTPLWTDLNRSHRAHYTSVLNRVVELNYIKETWESITNKINTNATDLNNIFLDRQEEGQKRQQAILEMLNIFFGASIIFELVSNITRNEDISGAINQWISIVILGLIAIVVGLYARRSKQNIEASE